MKRILVITMAVFALRHSEGHKTLVPDEHPEDTNRLLGRLDVLNKQLNEAREEVRNVTTTLHKFRTENELLSNKFGVVITRCQMEIIEKDFGPKNLTIEDDEKHLRRREIIWRRMLNYKRKRGDLLFIANEMNASHLTIDDFSRNVADLYYDLSGKIHTMVKHPDIHAYLTPIKTMIPTKCVPVFDIISKVYDHSEHTLG